VTIGDRLGGRLLAFVAPVILFLSLRAQRGNPAFLLDYLLDCLSELFYLDCFASLAMTRYAGT